MAEITIKVQTNDINIELQGENEIIERIFNDIRTNGIGKIEEKNANIVTVDKTEINNKNEKTEKKEISVKTEKKGKQVTQKKYEYIDLNLNKEDILDLEKFFSKSKAKTVQDQMLVLMYWYNTNQKSKNFDISFNCNLIYSLFRNIKITQTANLDQIRRNLLNRTLYIQKNQEVKDEFILAIHGQKYVEDLLKKNNEFRRIFFEYTKT